MIEAGLRQRAGENIGHARVKRQTIRNRGKRGEALLEWARRASWTIPYDLHLWWKSRTAERELLGVAVVSGMPPIFVYPITILHSSVQPVRGDEYQCIRITGPRGWRKGDACLFWSPDKDGGAGFIEEAYRDGFDGAESFRDFFVPNMGDRFEAILYKW